MVKNPNYKKKNKNMNKIKKNLKKITKMVPGEDKECSKKLKIFFIY